MKVATEPAPRRPRSRAESKLQTRGALLDAAALEFARHGFAGARVEKITARAGVTTGALYAHFGDKEGLFLAVYERYAVGRAREIETLGRASDEPGGRAESGAPAPALRAAADQWMARFDAEPWSIRLHLEFAEHARRDPELGEDFAERVAVVRRAAAELIERETAGAELPIDSDSLAAVLRALGLGLALERLVDPEAIPAALFGDFVELLFERLLAGSDG